MEWLRSLIGGTSYKLHGGPDPYCAEGACDMHGHVRRQIRGYSGKTVSSSSSTITSLTGACWSINFLTVSFLDLPSDLWLAAALTQPLTYPSHGGKGDD